MRPPDQDRTTTARRSPSAPATVQDCSRSDRHRHRHRGHRLRDLDLARRPDRTDTTRRCIPCGNQRVDKFVDFVNGRTLPYDDNGHGTHVAGIIAGNGYDSNGEKAGIAPDANIISLKVLDANGQRHDQQHHRGARLGARTTRDATTSASSTCRLAPAIQRVLLDRPADARGQGASTDHGHRRRRRGRQRRQERRGPAAVRRRSRRRATRPWVLTVGASSTNGTLTRDRRHDGGLQLARSDVHRLRREAGPGRARHRHDVAGRCRAARSTRRRRSSCSAAARGSAQAVSGAERHEHGGAGRQRHGRADAAGESER